MSDFVYGITILFIGIASILIITIHKESKLNIWPDGRFIINTSITFGSIASILIGIFEIYESIPVLLFAIFFSGLSISFIFGGFINLNREKVFRQLIGFIGITSGFMNALLLFTPLKVLYDNLKIGIFPGHAFLSLIFYTLFLVGIIKIFYIIDLYSYSYKQYFRVYLLFSLYALCIFILPSIIFFNLFYSPSLIWITASEFSFSLGWLFLSLLTLDENILQVFLPFVDLYFVQANIAGGINLFTISYKKTDLDFDFVSALVSSLNNALEMIIPETEYFVYTISLHDKILLVIHNPKSPLYYVAAAKSYPVNLKIAAHNLLLKESMILDELSQSDIFSMSPELTTKILEILLDSFGKRLGFKIVESVANF